VSAIRTAGWVLSEGGAAGAALRALDGAEGSPGPSELWPESLRAAVRTMLDSLQPTLVVWGPERRRFFNDAFAGLAMVDPGAQGTAARDLAGDRVWDALRSDVEAALAGRGPAWRERVEIPAMRDGGRAPGCWTVSCTPLRDPASPGGVGGAVVLCADATDAIRTAARFRATAEAVPGLVFASTSDGWNGFVNEGFCAFAGRPAEGLLGRGWMDLLHPDDTPAASDRWTAAVAEGRPFEAEYRFRRHDGAWRWHLVRSVPMRFEGGAAVEWVGTATDIHERREAEALARAQADELAATYDAAPVGLCVLDRDLRFVRINERLAEMNGAPAADHVGRSVREMVPDLHDDAEAALRRVLAGEELRGIEFAGRTPARPGVERAWRENWLPLRDRDGAIVGVTVSAEEITRERAWVEAQARSDERLRIATEAALLGIHDFDPETGRIEWDDRVRALWGVGPDEEVTYETFRAGVHPDDLPAAQAAVDAAMDPAGDGRFAAEYRVRPRGGGAERWVAATGRAAFRDGRAVRLVGTVQDVTERREEALRHAFLLELSDRLRVSPSAELTVAEALGRRFGVGRAGFSAADADGTTLTVLHERVAEGAAPVPGPHRLADFGPWLVSELTSGRTAVVDDATCDPRLGDGSAAFLRIGARSSVSVPVLRDGRLAATVYLNDAAPRRWTAGDVALVEEVARRSWDAVERQRAEIALRASESFARLVSEVAPSILYIYDLAERRNVWGNGDMLSALGYGTDGAAPTGAMIDALVHPDDHPGHAAHIAGLMDLRDGEAAEYEYRFRRSDGAWVWLLSRDMVFRRDADGRPTQIIGAALDVTSLKDTQEALRSLNAELEARVEAAVAERERALGQLHEARKTETIGQLTGGVAHDFNNLLSAILSNLDLARKRATDPGVERLLEGAVKAAERGAALTRRLLAFARRQDLKAQATDLRRLLGDMRDLLARSIGPTIAVDVDMPDDLPPVLVDANQLELAILNLALNAKDAMPDGGRLRVFARPETAERERDGLGPGAYVRLGVADDGCGMDAETARRAAEPFFTTKGVGKGTGLGLSMVQGLAAQSGGAMRIDSAPGRGATVELWLPRSGAPAPAAGPVGPDGAASAPDRPLTVLVVDDDALVAMGTVAMLEDLGHVALEAGGGPEALDVFAGRDDVDLVLTDQAMPGMTGLELARRLRRMAPWLPIVLATGYAELPEHDDLALQRLSKPFRQSELSRTLERARAAARTAGRTTGRTAGRAVASPQGSEAEPPRG
jgi:PAS domain S-box-containing protein